MKTLTKYISCLLPCFIIFATSCSVKAEEPQALTLTIKDAVDTGLKNSLTLQLVQNQINLAAVADERAYSNKKGLDSAVDSLKDGRRELSNAQEQLSKAKDALNAGIAPENIPLTDSQGNPLKDSSGNSLVIPAGTSISGYLSAIGHSEFTDIVKAGVQKELDAKQTQIDAGETKLSEGVSSLDQALEDAGAQLFAKLNTSNVGAVDADETGALMTTMADLSYEVSSASYDIYKGQISMLIQKSYYDALKAQYILDSKNKAMERAKKQYQFAADSYEAGMKAKDDLLLANIYYQGTQVEYQKAQGEYNNAIIELKKNMNIPLTTNITLNEVMQDTLESYDIEEGVKSGLQNRIEVKKAMAEVLINDLNFKVVSDKYPEITYQYREANLLKEKARLGYEKTKVDVESSIRQSYETLKSTGDMLTTSGEMVKQAQESLEIAELKYQEGMATESTLLKKLDLETSAGTILEVLAAEENLTQIEEKVIEITYGYNLAKVKYLNDIGITTGIGK